MDKQARSAPESIIPGIFKGVPGVVALQSTRKGGVSSGDYTSLNLGNNTGDQPELVRQNTLCLCASAGVDPGRLVSSTQVHGTRILYAEQPDRYEGYDAFITDKQDLFLSIFTADCFPVLILDPSNMASAAVHAGWKGSAGRIVMKTLDAMEKRFGSVPGECLAWIGTGISGMHYEVGREVASAFDDGDWQRSVKGEGENRYLLDLCRVNNRQLLAAGLPSSNIECSPLCSFTHSDLFYSYRRDNGKTGRMVSLIGITAGITP
ncbi:MAG: peptidoglycan editing factor PgeF [Chlorobiaceae bacterium]|nr:peptidoglycan editing factor PgeF [Chlorobiaceae bacterium]